MINGISTMTNNDPVLEGRTGEIGGSGAVPPTLKVVAGADAPDSRSSSAREARDWDPYHVWKRMIRKSPDPT